MPGPPGLPRETGDAVPSGAVSLNAVSLNAVPWDEVRDGPEPDEPSDAELLGMWPDPFAGSPDGADAWLADLSVPELDPMLAGFVADASATGLSLLSDDELIGLLRAARRLSSWHAAVELRAEAELDHRRRLRGLNLPS